MAKTILFISIVDYNGLTASLASAQSARENSWKVIILRLVYYSDWPRFIARSFRQQAAYKNNILSWNQPREPFRNSAFQFLI